MMTTTIRSELNNFCDLLPILRSPIIEGYRNKCEFTIGLNLDKEKTRIKSKERNE